MLRLGAEANAFEGLGGTIVASGARSTLPHGAASDKAIAAGELVIFDFGAVVGGYRSDCTRTVVMGRASAEQRRIHESVQQAQEAAAAGLRPGMTGQEADAIARGLIAAAGYSENFGHRLGHGVGLAVHEGPTLSPREEAVLEPGIVVRVEPGMYVPGRGGVRIEDLVVLRESGAEILTGFPRDLLKL